MSNSDNHASASRRPSLIDAAPSTPSDARLATEPTRVLADLGGHKPAGIPGGMVAVASCIVAIAVGAGFWATSGQPRTATVVVPPAVVTQVSAPPPASPPPRTMSAVEALNLPVSAAAPRQSEAASPAQQPGAARIVSDESGAIASVSAPAPRVAAPKAATSRTVPAKAQVPAPKPASGQPHPVATAKPAPAHASIKSAPGSKSGITTVARTGNVKRRDAPAGPEGARKHADPDTDLLAAMLRRNGGNSQ